MKPLAQWILLGLTTGVLIGVGWWLFLDGALHTQDAFQGLHLLPGFAATVAAVLVNFVDVNDLTSEELGAQTKAWAFVWLVVACLAIAHAIYITATEYPPDANWPGVSLILQTTLLFIAGLLFFAGRKRRSSSFSGYSL